MLGFATVRRFTVGRLTVPLGTFDLNRFTLGPFLAFTFIAAFAFSEFTHQSTPFDLDPSLAFLASNQDLTSPIIASFTNFDPFPRNPFTVNRIVPALDPHQVVDVIPLQHLRRFEQVVVLLTPLPFLIKFD